MEERTGTESDGSTPVLERPAAAMPKAPSRLSLLRQIRSLKLAGQACKVSPSAVVGTALATWCAAEFEALPVSGLPYSKKFAATPALQSFVKAVRQLGFLEASYWLSSAYAMLADETYRKQLSVVSATGKYQSVGKCRLPQSGEVWPIPRGVDDVPLLQAAGKSTFRLSHYGYRVRIGAFVWNRDKRPTFQCTRDVKRTRCRTAVPLLWSADISLDGQLQFDGATAKADEHRFVDLGSREHTSVVTRPGVVLQRVTSNTQARRLVAAAVPPRLFEEYGGFVGENHLVVLEPAVESPVLTPEELASLLAVPAVDRFFRCISGATNVSAFELGQLALPDPHRLKALLKSGLQRAGVAGGPLP